MSVMIHGKEYKTVAERVAEIHKDHNGNLTIKTEIVENDDTIVIMKATIFVSDNFFIGHAMEKYGSTMINKTSALENCETSAIGRALASAGYGGSEFASADEVANAIAQQNNHKVVKPKTPASMVITDKQINFLKKLAESSVVTSEEKNKLFSWIASEPTKMEASSQIEKMEELIKTRNEVKAKESIR